MIAARCAFKPVEATLAPGPKIPPSMSDKRVCVGGNVRPPGGPVRNFAIAVVNSLGKVLLSSNAVTHLVQKLVHTSQKPVHNLLTSQSHSSNGKLRPFVTPCLLHLLQTYNIVAPRAGSPEQHLGIQ